MIHDYRKWRRKKNSQLSSWENTQAGCTLAMLIRRWRIFFYLFFFVFSTNKPYTRIWKTWYHRRKGLHQHVLTITFPSPHPSVFFLHVGRPNSPTLQFLYTYAILTDIKTWRRFNAPRRIVDKYIARAPMHSFGPNVVHEKPRAQLPFRNFNITYRSLWFITP